MSHFTEVKTKIKDAEILKRTLKKLGHEVIENPNGVQVRGYFDETIPAEFKIPTTTKYDIGFRLNQEGCYEVVGDWELLPKVSGIDQVEFGQKLKKEYAHQTVLTLAEKMGYSVEYLNAESQDGQIELSLKSYG